MARKSKQPEKPSTAWQTTYGDMITLMLCFFVMLYNPTEVDITQLATITQALQMRETETTAGGLALSTGRLADLGNNINSLPAMEKGRSLANARNALAPFRVFQRPRTEGEEIPHQRSHRRYARFFVFPVCKQLGAFGRPCDERASLSCRLRRRRAAVFDSGLCGYASDVFERYARRQSLQPAGRYNYPRRRTLLMVQYIIKYSLECKPCVCIGGDHGRQRY